MPDCILDQHVVCPRCGLGPCVEVRTGPVRYEDVAFSWAVKAFGEPHVYNATLRSLRVAEEAVELAQAHSVTKAEMMRLVDVVYGKPPGEPAHEIGGVLMTLAVLCKAQGKSLGHFFTRELQRVLSKPIEHYTQRNREKLKLMAVYKEGDPVELRDSHDGHVLDVGVVVDPTPGEMAERPLVDDVLVNWLQDGRCWTRRERVNHRQ